MHLFAQQKTFRFIKIPLNLLHFSCEKVIVITCFAPKIYRVLGNGSQLENKAVIHMGGGTMWIE